MTRPEAFAFVAGGTVQAGNGVYVERAADADLLAHCRVGDFTYVLTSRQMGKSSLMIRTAERLTAEDAHPIIIDLTEFGAQTTAEQWYRGLLVAVQDSLNLETRVSDWWPMQRGDGYAHRFTRYLREVALAQCSKRLVLFIDEIDTTLRLDFTDDFFAAIRFLYQNRATEPDLQRLSFVLIGVATPGDLIKDAARTPFNVGHRIELTDFTLDEASALVSHLPVPAPVGRDLIARILRWTGGHPYLTLRLVRSLVETPPKELSEAAVSDRVTALFLGAQGESDSNLQFVRDMLTRKAFDREAVLRTYRDVRRGGPVKDRELDQVSSWLKLSGIVRRSDGMLRVRNAIYEQVFDERWAADHLELNLNWRRRLTRVAAVLLAVTALVTIPLAIFAWQQKIQAEYQAQEASVQRREAERQRDEAQRQRLIAEHSLRDTTTALATAQQALDELQRYNPKTAAALSAQVSRAREDANALRSSGSVPTAVVPKVTGLTREAAQRQLTQAGFRLDRVIAQQAPAPAGTVLGQSPGAGTRATRGAAIVILVAAGTGDPVMAALPSEVVDGVQLGEHESVVLPAPPFSSGIVVRAGNISKRDAELSVALTATGDTIAKKRLSRKQTLRFNFANRKFLLSIRDLDPDEGEYVVIAIVGE